MAAIVFVLIVTQLCWTVAQSNTLQPRDVTAHIASTEDFGLCELRLGDNGWRLILYKQLFINEDTTATGLWTSYSKVFYTQTITQATALDLFIDDIKEVNITYSNITAFKSDLFCYFPRLVYVDLSYNHLDDVTKLGLNLSHECSRENCGHQLLKLNLNGNPLRVIRNTSFCQLKELVNLYLDDCELRVIEPGALLSMKRLRELSLNGNHLKNWACELPRASNSYLPDAYFTLHLRNNGIVSVGLINIMACVRLRYLDMSYNAIVSIEEMVFGSIFGVNVLNLSNNRLQSVNKTFFWTPIDILYLNNNQLTAIDLTDFSIWTRDLYLRGNHITQFSCPDSYKTYLAKLRKIDLSNNRLIKLEEFYLPLSVSVLILKDNRIDFITFDEIYMLYIMKGNSLLEYVDLQNNSLTVVPRMPFNCHDGGRSVTPSYNLNGNPLLCSCVYTWLLQMTTKSEIPPCTPPVTFNASHLLPKDSILSKGHLCESSYLDSNRCLFDQSADDFLRNNASRCPFSDMKCNFTCPSPCYCYTTFDLSLVHLYCSKFQMTSIPQSFDRSQLSSESEVILWLDGNNFNTINSTDFDNFPYAVQLYMNSSHIRIIRRLAFAHLTVLRVLNLKDNNLEVLPNGVFDNLTLLQKLYLSNNKLSQLNDDTFNHFNSLQVLHLHHNQLTNFEVWKFKNLSSLNELTLHNNSWSCDCSFVRKFRDHLIHHGKTIHDASLVECIDQDGHSSPTSILNFDVSVCNVADKGIMWYSIGSVCALLIISVSLSYCYRHEVQLLINSRVRRRVLSNVNESEGKLFDVFVAYSNDDFDFMYNNILPGLEGIDNPYKVCVHERDFLAGCVITDNILEAVRISTRTIIVLTDNFVRSGWCRFEFKAAHLQMLEDRCPRVLVIVVGRIPANLEPEMLLYLKTNTYLTWGEPCFWQKVYNSMPKQRATGIGVARSPNLMPEEFEIIEEIV